MAQQWEYMTVSDETESQYRVRTITKIGPPNFTRDTVDVDYLSGEPMHRLLNELGADGWEVFSVRENLPASFYWLKRLRG